MNLNLRYGNGSITLAFPSHSIIPEYREPIYSITREGFENDLLRLLPDDKSSYKNVAVVVSDKTRLCGYPDYLPWLTELLFHKGALRENITFYIAYGTHARQSDDESMVSYGESYRQFRFVHHDCTDVSVFGQLGTTNRGTPVAVRKDILESTLIITFGSISHHYFAGYGGGRKMLFPGLGSKKAIYHNHSLFLDYQQGTLAAGCQPGNLNGNPLAEDLKEIDSYLPSRISIHGILDASGKVCRLIAGNTYRHFEEACTIHDSYFRYGGKDEFDLVVASGGGYPKDINFIQSHKSIHHAAAFVKDGGDLIVLCECADKIGSSYFMKYMEAGSFKSAFEILSKSYEGNGGTALSMMSKTARIRIHMVTSLDEDMCHTLNVRKIDTDEVRQMINKQSGTIAVIKNASMLVK